MSSPLQWKLDTNRTRKKSRAGCKVCKLRKIRCGEEQPSCNNCKMYYSDRPNRCEYENVMTLPTRKARQVSAKTSSARNDGFFIPFDDPKYRALPPRRSCFASVLGNRVWDLQRIHPPSELPQVDEVLCYCNAPRPTCGCVARCIPVGCQIEQTCMVREWWPLMQRDLVLFTSMMYLNTNELEWKRGKPNSYHSQVYSLEVIRLLQERIDDPILATSDGSIAAVAIMAAVEFGRKNMAMVNIHTNGLKRMVAMRGGLLNVRDSNQCVAAVISWLTLNSMHDSIFPVDETVEHSMHLEYLLRDVENDHISLPSRYLDVEVLGLERFISDIFVEARYFCEKFNTSRLDNVCWDVNSILHRLLQYKISREDPYTASLNEACRYAVCIFMFLPFDNQFPDPTLVLNTFVYKLKAALNEIAFSSASNGPLLFWLLSVGTATSTSPLERDWFIGHLIPVAESLNVGSWKDMEEAMQKILWMTDILDCLFVQVWADIKHRTSARDEIETFKAIGFPKYPNCPRFVEC